ncbi:DNA-binding protein BIN4 isoform X3 [Malania oleifera]|uniref:DNA-binding protein BIN4 isoform X3 n=1 Tax=Malania oleifera TaxID=397392 RepID=UPI0025AE1699|nr:DNA-binding protein BIN4 isoform X3 [Malania oleifera]
MVFFAGRRRPSLLSEGSVLSWYKVIMSSSREGSPDWLRCFQAPTNSTLILSSDSGSSPNDSPLRKDVIDDEEPPIDRNSQFQEDKDQKIGLSDNVHVSQSHKNSKPNKEKKQLKAENDLPMKKKKIYNHKKRQGNGRDAKITGEETFRKRIKPVTSVWTVSSDSESCPDNSSARDKEVSVHRTSQFPDKGKGSANDVQVAEEEIVRKHIEPQVCSSRLPLVLPEKVHLSKALTECEGESIDLSGDMGAVGRIVISDGPSKNHEMFLDLKGTIYKTTIVPSRAFCVVSFGQSEAKIEAIMSDFIQLKPQSNVYEAETMVEGTLEGFSFDLDDEVDKMPKAVAGQTGKKESTEEQNSSKCKGIAEKTSRVGQKKGKKTAAGKLPKKARRNAQVSKKAKAKK